MVLCHAVEKVCFLALILTDAGKRVVMHNTFFRLGDAFATLSKYYEAVTAGIWMKISPNVRSILTF